MIRSGCGWLAVISRALVGVIETLTAGAGPDRDLLDLRTTRDPEERSGAACAGNSQDLAHPVISPGLEDALVPGSVDVAHVNAEFADHASDRDPQVALLVAAVTSTGGV